MSWTHGDIQIATLDATGAKTIITRPAFLFEGLGLVLIAEGMAILGLQPIFDVIHIGSGHAVCRIQGAMERAMTITAEIAKCTDWTFDGLDGWINRDRDLPARVREVTGKYRECRPVVADRSEALAKRIAMERD